MSKRPTDPRRLDVAAFAEGAGRIEGEWPLSALPRLAESADGRSADDADAPVTWRVRGEARKVNAAPAQAWLHLDAAAQVALLCQRCLNPVRVNVVAQRSFRFVHDEEAAAELDEHSEDDVLVLTRALDVQDLVEDELLLGLPLVPKHTVCPQPLPAPDGAGDEPADRPHPFAALASLKGRRRDPD